VGPNYWFTDTENGGAYGFNTETGPGAQLPVRESIEKFVPADELWPLGESMDYHCTTAANMNSLKVMTEVVNAKYGEATDLDDYLKKADLAAYESTRSMFEAFRVNKSGSGLTDGKPATTGLIQWMLNSAWPSMYWQLYDYYGIPTSSYYGVKRANNPYQLVFNYADDGIYLVNELGDAAAGMTARIEVYNMDSERTLLEREKEISSPANSSIKITEIERPAEGVFFLSLKLQDADDRQIADNFYVLTARDDVHDYANNEWYMTPISEYADFRPLADMAPATIDFSAVYEGDKVRVTLENPSKSVAFFTTLKLKDSKGEMVCPAFWSDNYISLLPGETRTVECLIEKSGPDARKLSVEVSGWNVGRSSLKVK
jgi:exo-1,4-beta-D-glucosaminidase